MKRSGVAVIALLALTVSVSSAHAQLFDLGDERPRTPSRAFAGGSLQLGIPQGEFADFVSVGGGMAGHFIYQLDPFGALALRVDGGFIVYGQERQRVCFSSTAGCRVTLDLTTTHSIFFLGIGPQLIAPSGRLRPYATGSVGFGHFSTESALKGTVDLDDFARTRNFSDATLAWTGAGGVYVPLRAGMRPVLLDIGARYHDNGVVSYLHEGSIIDHPDGSITINPTRSEANLWVVHFGVSVGL